MTWMRRAYSVSWGFLASVVAMGLGAGCAVNPVKGKTSEDVLLAYI